MKNKGFTLIELLAVIVILAIIALIAVPIILNIIGEAKGQSVERSIELYGNAIKNAVADYSLKHPTEEDITFDDIKDSIEYEGSKVECETHEIYSDGNIWLKDCTVNGSLVEYTYGKEQEGKYKQVYKPQYYWYGTTEQHKVSEVFSEETSKTPPVGHDFYIGMDLREFTSKVLAVYVCFKRNGNEYCLKGNDTTAYDTNVSIIKDAFADVVNDGSSCSFSAASTTCDGGSLVVAAYSSGIVSASDGVSTCDVDSDGPFYCGEW